MLDLGIDEHHLKELCDRYGTMRLAVFESVARGEGTADSDIDLLYDLRPGAHLSWEIEDLTELTGYQLKASGSSSAATSRASRCSTSSEGESVRVKWL